jgi:hypothetical protein
MADRPDRLAGLEEGADELDRVGVGTQLVGVGDASGQHEPVVGAGVCIADRPVRGEGVALVEVVESLDRILFGREQIDLGTRIAQRRKRTGQLDLLDPLVGDEDRDPLALQLV